MKITHIEVGHPDLIQGALYLAIENSRFTAKVWIPHEYTGNSVRLTDVRLRESKEYCGNHAKACENTFRKHRKHKYLEGADWVEFNDLINNTLDKLGYVCRVASTKRLGCIIRKGALRRIYYDANTFVGEKGFNGEWRWDYDSENPEHWTNNLGGEPMISGFPTGTPGIHTGKEYAIVG